MPEKQVYEYAFIRFVPRVERGECLNVGVIVLCKRMRFLRMKYHIVPKRLLAIAGEADLSELEDYLRAWDVICRGEPKGERIAQLDPAGRFRWLTAPRSTIIQSSRVHPGLCSNPEEVVEELFRKYVL